MAKRNEGKYEVVDKLPKKAIFVKDYAEQLGIGQPAIYNRYFRALKKGQNPDFKIVIYLERNFIIENEK